MIIPRSFTRGGIDMPQRKKRSRKSHLANSALPSVCIIPLLQHNGEAALLQVSPGDRVREGMLIGKASGPGSANIHSPIPGLVREIRGIHLPDGAFSNAIVIELQGEFDRLGKKVEPASWGGLSLKELVERIMQMGVVETGNDMLPVHYKIQRARKKSIEHLIFNSCETEAYISSDYRLLSERIDCIAEGLEIIRKLVKPACIHIAVEQHKRDIVRLFKDRLSTSGSEVRIAALKTRYPQEDERQLTDAVLGFEIPSGKSSIDTGALIFSAGTLFAVYEAVVLSKPFIERIITVSGDAVRREANLKVRIGTPVRDLLQECGGFRKQPAKLVIGGPMRGYTISDINMPVTKTTSGILALTEAEMHRARRYNCVQCGRCVRSCPIGLEPVVLHKLIEHGRYTEAVDSGMFDCTECGCCAYNCPSRIPLVQSLKTGKIYVHAQGSGS